MTHVDRTVAIVQARMGSSRLPGKVLEQVGGQPLLGVLLIRLSKARLVDEVVVATSNCARDDVISEYVRSLGYPVFRGSELDVLDRFHGAALEYYADVIVRITADCPLLDPHLVDEVIFARARAQVDYASNNVIRTFPHGLDVEAFTRDALERAWSMAIEPYDREHVTPFTIRETKGNQVVVRNLQNLSGHRWTVDEPEDLLVVRNVFSKFHPRLDFSWWDVLELEETEPGLFAANKRLIL